MCTGVGEPIQDIGITDIKVYNYTQAVLLSIFGYNMEGFWDYLA